MAKTATFQITLPGTRSLAEVRALLAEALAVGLGQEPTPWKKVRATRSDRTLIERATMGARTEHKGRYEMPGATLEEVVEPDGIPRDGYYHPTRWVVRARDRDREVLVATGLLPVRRLVLRCELTPKQLDAVWERLVPPGDEANASNLVANADAARAIDPAAARRWVEEALRLPMPGRWAQRRVHELARELGVSADDREEP